MDRPNHIPEPMPGQPARPASDDRTPRPVPGWKRLKKAFKDNRVPVIITVLATLLLVSTVLFVNYYTEYRRLGRLMEAGLAGMNKRESLYERMFREFGLMEFKIFAFEKKYPRFAKIVNKAFQEAGKNKLSPYTVLSVIQVESNFDPEARSSVAYGLMQINLKAWKNHYKIEEKKIYNIDYNIELGCKILKHYLDRSGGDLARALYLYNNGYAFHNEKYVSKVLDNAFFKDR